MLCQWQNENATHLSTNPRCLRQMIFLYPKLPAPFCAHSVKNWCFQTVVLEKTLESPLDSKEIKPVSPKGNHPWIFIGRIHAEAEAPIFWLPDVKSRLIGKDLDAGEDSGQEEKGETGLDGITDSMHMDLSKLRKVVKDREAWHGCSSWGHKELGTEQQQSSR